MLDRKAEVTLIEIFLKVAEPDAKYLAQLKALKDTQQRKSAVK